MNIDSRTSGYPQKNACLSPASDPKCSPSWLVYLRLDPAALPVQGPNPPEACSSRCADCLPPVLVGEEHSGGVSGLHLRTPACLACLTFGRWSTDFPVGLQARHASTCVEESSLLFSEFVPSSSSSFHACSSHCLKSVTSSVDVFAVRSPAIGTEAATSREHRGHRSKVCLNSRSLGYSIRAVPLTRQPYLYLSSPRPVSRLGCDISQLCSFLRFCLRPPAPVRCTMACRG